MTEVKINEGRFFELRTHELEAVNLFEQILALLTDEFKIKYPSNKKIEECVTYINARLKERSIKFNGQVPELWLSSRWITMYWSYSDSKSITLDL